MLHLFFVILWIITMWVVPVQGQSARDLYNEGTLFLKDGKLSQAISKLEQAVKIQPDLVAAHFNLGIAFERQGTLDKAIEAYKTALNYRKEIRFYMAIGSVYHKKGQDNDAIAFYQKAIETDPNASNGYVSLGNLYLDTGAMDKAIAAYKQALSHNLSDPGPVYYNLGVAYQKSGHLKEAVSAYETYLKFSPKSPNVKRIQEIIQALQEKLSDSP